MVVDEEQRFGVTHKERLKALKADVHMLTLTATPIPRTLQMAMSGLRELSVIQTPPVDRLAVRTYVMPWDPVVLREALLREHYRGGQSFFVTPRVADLPDIEEFLRKEVPEIRYVVAHGQMAPTEVEERMSAFYDRKFEVLVSTTIVESGLDIPRANTMIVNRADRFGLAQLYQLRGRVGRGKTRAYCLSRHPARADGDRGGGQAAARCCATSTRSAPASSSRATTSTSAAPATCWATSSRGTSRRSASNSTSRCWRRRSWRPRRAAAGASARRLLAPDHRRRADPDPGGLCPRPRPAHGALSPPQRAGGRAAIEAFAAEMIDRFGPLPDATANLIRVIEIKLERAHGVRRQDRRRRQGRAGHVPRRRPPNVAGLLAYVDRLGGIAKLRPDSKLVITRAWGDPKARLNGALQLSKGLAKAAG